MIGNIEIGPNLLAAVVALCSAATGIAGYYFGKFVQRQNGKK